MMDADKQKELKQLSQYLEAKGFQEVRYYIKRKKRQYLNVRNQQIYSRDFGDETEYLAEGQKAGRRGYTYFNQPFNHAVIADRMNDCAKSSIIPWQERQYCQNGDLCDEPWEDPAEIKAVLEAAEKKAFAIKETAVVSECSYETVRETIYLLDHQENLLSDQTSYSCGRLRIVSKANGHIETGDCCIYGEKIRDLNIVEAAAKTAAMAAEGLGGIPVLSGEYPILLENRVAAEILEAFLPVFYAENLYDGMSVLSGKEGTSIGTAALQLMEQPLLPGGRCRRKVDDEGIPVQEKSLITDGIFTAKLYNSAAAVKESRKSSGNGFKSSAAADVETGVTNIVIRGGEDMTKSQEQLIKQMGEGLLVTGVDGVFAGVNHQTGDFSLIAKGLQIKPGKKTKPFREVTIAGNFIKLLQDIEGLGEEWAMTLPARQCVAAPDILMKKLTVSGL